MINEDKAEQHIKRLSDFLNESGLNIGEMIFLLRRMTDYLNSKLTYEFSLRKKNGRENAPEDG